jgi:pimeloyl-ACP methyl ester carboxylesterase
MSDLEMEFYVSEYSRTGFTGGLNWYRAMDLRWAQRKPFDGKNNPAPFFFIGSEQDVDLEGFHGDDPLGQLRSQYSDLREVAMIKNAGHVVQMEKPNEVNALMLGFLETLKR